MNYFRHYKNLIRKAQKRNKGVEKHHIFPRAIFGDNDGVVALTMREHYVAHKLLFHICKSRYGSHPHTYKMAAACNMMGNRSSRYYETTRQYFVDNHHTKTQVGRDFISNRMKGNTNVKGKTLGRRPDEVRAKISATKSCTYKVTFTDNTSCVIVNMRKWAKAHGYNDGHLIQIGKGNRKKHKNIIGVEKLD